MSNAVVGRYDSGAVGCGRNEADIVARIADQVESRIANDPNFPVTVTRSPECSSYCGGKHKASSHLSYTVRYLNEHQIIAGGRPADFILSLHMNSSENAEASGTEVYYSKAAVRGGARWHQAVRVAIAVSSTLGIPNRGIFRSDDSQHSSLAILDSTKAPALLIELGFITNGRDVKAVEECGADAVIAAITAILRPR